MTSIELKGCHLRPLGSYLKALGVLRLVGEQLDANATGFWVGDTFRIDTTVDRAGLVNFFVNDYAPTPIVSPWNGGSGFSPSDKAALKAINAILATDEDRFADYRSTIHRARALVESQSWSAGGKDAKARQIALCRSSLPDRAVEWLDSSVVLASDRAVFPPLFGTGGNDGRLEFSSNFMQRFVELLIEPRGRTAPSVVALLENALFETASVLEKGTAGQYDPASIDLDTTSASGRKTELSNPWDFILLLEGGLVFASAAARRLGSGINIRAAMPFCVDSSPIGAASSADGEEARGEIWAPVWHGPATLLEVVRLIGEGRAQWGRSQAGNGVDFAKAVATLGVDRGIERFVRHGIVQRNGLAFFSVPFGEFAVGARPEVKILLQIDRWLQALKRQLPASAEAARQNVQRAQFRAATQTSARPAADLIQVLIALADLELAIARSSDRHETRFPVGGGGSALPADDWLPKIDDGTTEFRIAVALASARDRLRNRELDLHARTASSLSLSFRPIQLNTRGGIEWAPRSPRVDGLGNLPIVKLLGDALVDREVRWGQRPDIGGERQGPGVDIWFETGTQIDADDLLALAEGRVDLGRLGELFRGLLLLDWRRRDPSGDRYQLMRPQRAKTARRSSPAMALLLPFFHGQQFSTRRADDSEVKLTLRPQSGWARRLAIGRIDDVLDDAVHRLRIEGLRPAVERVRPTPAEVDGALVVAAFCRTSPRTIERFIRQTCPSDVQINEFANQIEATTKENQ